MVTSSDPSLPSNFDLITSGQKCLWSYLMFLWNYLNISLILPLGYKSWVQYIRNGVMAEYSVHRPEGFGRVFPFKT